MINLHAENARVADPSLSYYLLQMHREDETREQN